MRSEEMLHSGAVKTKFLFVHKRRHGDHCQTISKYIFTATLLSNIAIMHTPHLKAFF